MLIKASQHNSLFENNDDFMLKLIAQKHIVIIIYFTFIQINFTTLKNICSFVLFFAYSFCHENYKNFTKKLQAQNVAEVQMYI